MKLCRVVKPGLLTTVQDWGRFGFQKYGVPVSGAMDTYAFVAANLLVGNKSSDACLEIALLGPELKFLSDVQIAIAGAELSPTLNGDTVACWKTLRICEGDVLSFGSPRSGCRAYLAARGGIDVPVVLGSRSTYVRGCFGGFHGRQLKAGDVVEVCKPKKLLDSGFSMPHEFIPRYGRESTVEVVLGPQSDCFTNNGVETFLSSVCTVTDESDRMGYRLDGPEVEQRSAINIVSEAIPVGAVQVPESGKPIIVMRDAQTTGGYPKIAVITTPDVSHLGQAKPNDEIRFSKISPSKAREKLLEYMKALNQLRSKLEEAEL